MRLRALSFNVNFQSGLEPHCEIVIPDGYLSKSVFNLALVEFSKVSAGRTRKGTEADKVWNEQHFGGAKSVVITGADVKIRATFYCDLIDTTTRQSLL